MPNEVPNSTIDEWKRTGELLDGMMADPGSPPLQRQRATVQAFFVSEWRLRPGR